MRGMTHLYYGDGKGKTTAAVGLAVRAAGQGIQVIFAQFFKTAPSGELAMLEKLGITVLRGDLPSGFTWTMNEQQLAALRKGHDELLQKAFSLAAANEKTLLVLDEVIDAYAGSFMDAETALTLFQNRPDSIELVLTGHSAPESLVSLADYITEMKAHRHPYELGISARKGIEF